MNLATALVITGVAGAIIGLFGVIISLTEVTPSLRKSALFFMVFSVLLAISGSALMDYHMAHQIVKEIK